jgi:hypothetical protein
MRGLAILVLIGALFAVAIFAFEGRYSHAIGREAKRVAQLLPYEVSGYLKMIGAFDFLKGHSPIGRRS